MSIAQFPYEMRVNDRLVRYVEGLDCETVRRGNREAMQAGYRVLSDVYTDTSRTIRLRRSRRDSELPSAFRGGDPVEIRVAIVLTPRRASNAND